LLYPCLGKVSQEGSQEVRGHDLGQGHQGNWGLAEFRALTRALSPKKLAQLIGSRTGVVCLWAPVTVTA